MLGIPRSSSYGKLEEIVESDESGDDACIILKARTADDDDSIEFQKKGTTIQFGLHMCISTHRPLQTLLELLRLLGTAKDEDRRRVVLGALSALESKSKCAASSNLSLVHEVMSVLAISF